MLVDMCCGKVTTSLLLLEILLEGEKIHWNKMTKPHFNSCWQKQHTNSFQDIGLEFHCYKRTFSLLLLPQCFLSSYIGTLYSTLLNLCVKWTRISDPKPNYELCNIFMVSDSHWIPVSYFKFSLDSPIIAFTATAAVRKYFCWGGWWRVCLMVSD